MYLGELDHRLAVRAAPVKRLEQPVELRHRRLQVVGVFVHGDVRIGADHDGGLSLW